MDSTVDIEIALNRIEPPIDTAELFGRRAPLEVEIGFGKGLFLLRETERRPEADFLGIEIASKYFKWTRRLLEAEERRNVRIVREEAGYFIERYLADASVSRFHMYYPDPWPKRRHHRRRLFTDAFLEVAGRKLIAGGEFRIATDFDDYWAVIDRVLGRVKGFERVEDDERWADWMTNFRRKYEREQRAVHRACVVRMDEEPS